MFKKNQKPKICLNSPNIWVSATKSILLNITEENRTHLLVLVCKLAPYLEGKERLRKEVDTGRWQV